MKKILIIFLSIILLQQTSFSQKLKKEISKSELEKVKEGLRSPIEMGFNIAVSRIFLNGKYAKNKQEIAKAKQEAEDKLSKDSRNTDLLIAVSNYYTGEEKIKYLQKALDILEEDTKDKAVTGNDYYTVAKIFYASGEYQKSLVAYQEAAKMIPDTSNVWSSLASLIMTQGINEQSIKGAREFSEKAINSDLENIDGHIVYCQSFIMEKLMNTIQSTKGKPQKNIEIDYTYLDKLITQYPNKKIYEVLKNANQLVQIFYDLTISSADEVKEDVDYEEFFKPNSDQFAKFKYLEKYFKKALKKKYVDKLFIYDMLGSIYLMQNKHSKALYYFEKIVAEDKLTSNRFYNTAFVYGIQENWGKITPLIEMKEELAEFDHALLSFVEYKQGNYEKALEKCEKGRKEFFNSALLLHIKGRVKYDLGDIEEAEEILRESTRIEQNDEALFLQAVIALEQEKWEEAYHFLQKSEELENERARKFKDTYFE